MLKTTSCACGGEYENTPSRRHRHNQTNKHLSFVWGAQIAAKRSTRLSAPEASKLRVAAKWAEADAKDLAKATAASSAAPAPTSKKVSKAQTVRDLLFMNPEWTLKAIADGAGVSYEYAWDVRAAVRAKGDL